jgi:AraC family transcriptional regulator of adaptative response / DNA-3-methyladenine glycosylase II
MRGNVEMMASAKAPRRAGAGVRDATNGPAARRRAVASLVSDAPRPIQATEVRDLRWYAALQARDRRFDGVFFVAVSTTGIYCRPVCAARTPGRDRCTFFTDAAQAEKAGYRACFRCRPELAPGAAPVDARSRLVRAALSRVDAGFLNEGSIEALARALGVTGRHLRRVVAGEVGASLVEIAQSRRLAMARRLLADSGLSVAAIAFASGFRSVRRLNALFAQRYGRAPSRWRRGGSHPKVGRTARGTKAPSARSAGPGGEPFDGAGALSLRLSFRPPFDWADLLAFLGPRAIAGVEKVTPGVYGRTVRVGKDIGLVSVGLDPGGDHLRVTVTPQLVDHLMAIVSRLRVLFDLDARPDVVAAHLAGDALLAPLVRQVPGLRLPGAFDPFEAAVRAVLGQQISVRAAATLAARLVARFGQPLPPGASLPSAPGLTHTFPPPHQLAATPVDQLASIGLTGARAATLRALAALFTDPTFLTAMETGERDEVTRLLKQVRGIGDWTAAYLAMRALHDPDAFPAGDLGVRKALGGLPLKQAEARAEAWRPWRAYAVMHLWGSLGPRPPQLIEQQPPRRAA